MVRPLDVPVHLGAEKPARERVLGVAGNPRGAPIFDRHQHGARVRTVVRACTADNRRLGERRRMGGHISLGAESCKLDRSAKWGQHEDRCFRGSVASVSIQSLFADVLDRIYAP